MVEIKHFKSWEEAVTALEEIEPLDLTKPQPKDKAVEHCVKIMCNWVGTRDLIVYGRYVRENYIPALINAGCCDYESAHDMFKTETYTIGDIKDKKGDIQLPLAIFSEILKDGGSDLAYVHGNERHNGCIDSWLKAQGLSALREK